MFFCWRKSNKVCEQQSFLLLCNLNVFISFFKKKRKKMKKRMTCIRKLDWVKISQRTRKAIVLSRYFSPELNNKRHLSSDDKLRNNSSRLIAWIEQTHRQSRRKKKWTTTSTHKQWCENRFCKSLHKCATGLSAKHAKLEMNNFQQSSKLNVIKFAKIWSGKTELFF